MRVHLKNVVHSAMERGVVVGYHRIDKLPQQKRSDSDTIVDTILASIWEALDGIIDFSDDDGHDDDRRRPIGFVADAVSNTTLDPVDGAATPTEDDDDDDDGIVPLDVLYRVRRSR